MENEEDKIRTMLSNKFDQKSEPMALSDFDKIQLKVSNKKFFTFQPRAFNIYYALAVASIWLLTLGVGVDYYLSKQQLKKDLNELNLKIESYNQQLELLQNANAISITTVKPTLSSDSVISRVKAGKVVTKNASKITSKKTSTTVEPSKGTDASTAITTDSLHHLKLVERAIVAKPKVPVYIIKQDTIIRFDSIHVKKKH